MQYTLSCQRETFFIKNWIGREAFYFYFIFRTHGHQQRIQWRVWLRDVQPFQGINLDNRHAMESIAGHHFKPSHDLNPSQGVHLQFTIRIVKLTLRLTNFDAFLTINKGIYLRFMLKYGPFYSFQIPSHGIVLRQSHAGNTFHSLLSPSNLSQAHIKKYG